MSLLIHMTNCTTAYFSGPLCMHYVHAMRPKNSQLSLTIALSQRPAVTEYQSILLQESDVTTRRTVRGLNVISGMPDIVLLRGGRRWLSPWWSVCLSGGLAWTWPDS